MLCHKSGKPGGPPCFCAFEPTIPDNGLLRQPETGFQAGLDTGSSRGKDLLHQLSVRRVKSNLFLRGTSIRQGVALPFWLAYLLQHCLVLSPLCR